MQGLSDKFGFVVGGDNDIKFQIKKESKTRNVYLKQKYKIMKGFYFILFLVWGVQNIFSQYDVSIQQKITENVGGFSASLDLGDEFGYATEAIGDLNGDGINDLAVSARQDDDVENDRGAVCIYGNVVYKGNHNTPAWDGTSKHGLGDRGNSLPTATYFYVLDLNDPEFQILKGWVYLMR